MVTENVYVVTSQWDFDRQPNERVADLMAAGSHPAVAWPDAELGAILRHQLDTPIEAEVGGRSETVVGELLAALHSAGGSPTLVDVLAHLDPPLALLEMLKEFAKSLLEHPESALPKEVAGILYWTAIAAAMARKGAKISRLPDVGIRAGLAWSLSRSWLDSRLRPVLEAAVEGLTMGDGHDS
jgi:hypothetical protein